MSIFDPKFADARRPFAGGAVLALALATALALRLAAADAPAAGNATPAPDPAAALPPRAPADANPFANEQALPQPMAPPRQGPQTLTVATQAVPFDGLSVTLTMFKGPDFEWAADPFNDWIDAPAAADETAALASRVHPEVRLGLVLYKTGDFLPDLSPASLLGYLAAVRAAAPQDFVLLTPFPSDAPRVGQVTFGGFDASRIEYAMVSHNVPVVVTQHRDYFIDLHHEYLLIARLSGPPALLQAAQGQVDFSFTRSTPWQGLGRTTPPPQ